MKTSTKAALYSALLFPGFGQYYTGARKKGALIIAVITGLVMWLGVRIYSLVYEVLTGGGGSQEILGNINEENIALIHRLAYKENLWLVIFIINKKELNDLSSGFVWIRDIPVGIDLKNRSLVHDILRARRRGHRSGAPLHPGSRDIFPRAQHCNKPGWLAALPLL